MALTTKGYDRELERDVALKLIRPELLDEAAATRFWVPLFVSLHLAAANPFNLSLLIFSTMPALRSATSLILYSAAEPSTCATSDGVNL